MAMYKDAEEIASVLDKYENYIDIGENTPLFVAIIECVKAVISAVQAVDAVEVVRCKGCCHIFDGDCPITWEKTDDDFCSFGERRE